ncbi:MAG: ABC transporter ATP-binding protein [Candidatus Thorarchaeota archaeon]
MSNAKPLLDIKDLKTYFYTEDGVVKAVDGIDLQIGHKETVGIVGESGCGKTVTSLSVMRLVPNPPGRIIQGSIHFDGKNILELSEAQMRSIRGADISMIFQDPMTSLNPVFTVGHQISEAIMNHQDVDEYEAMERASQMMDLVGIPDPDIRIKDFPHLFSGGMRQRVMIAMALSCNPKMLVADEPTTALDVTIQAQVLELMKNLKRDLDTSIMYITHNLGVIAEICDHVAVMYAGNIVEMSDVRTVFKNPQHPYTVALLASIPRLDKRILRLDVIRGFVPNLINPPSGCRFHPRCKYAFDRCSKEVPGTYEAEPNHTVRCHLFDPDDYKGLT